jgi:hypothetical protein
MIKYKPTKCNIFKLMIQFLILMSSTCFEHEGSSSGRPLNIKVRYSELYVYHYKRSYGYKGCLYPRVKLQEDLPEV